MHVSVYLGRGVYPCYLLYNRSRNQPVCPPSTLRDRLARLVTLVAAVLHVVIAQTCLFYNMVALLPQLDTAGFDWLIVVSA